jgi:hypothetical protein
MPGLYEVEVQSSEIDNAAVAILLPAELLF